jgi:peptide/nickel transport system substrate-binding protein/oligopeptide transport system substrate-binding protein
MIHFYLSVLIVFAHIFLPVSWSCAQEPRDRATVPRYGGTYRRPLPNNPSTLDPPLITDTYGHTVAQQIFDGLVQYDGSLNITPAIAQDWKASRDGLSWTFFLRRGTKFHNGREVVADDVVYSFTRILDPKTRSNAAELFLKIRGAKEFTEGRARNVEGLRALDSHTVQIQLTEASAPFVATLAIGYAMIVPKEAVEGLGKAFGMRPIGAGPFRFVHWKKDEEIVLEANPEYYGGRPFLDRVVYRIFTGHQTEEMFRSFEQRELEDTIIPTAALARVRDSGQYQFFLRSMLGVRFLGFLTNQGPLANRTIRQAFNYAIDREALVREVYKNRYKPALGFLPPGTYGYDPQYRPYPFDPQHAKTLLAKAGYPGGKGLPTFEAWSNPNSEAIKQEHQAIQRYLAEVGIKVEFQYNTDWPTFKSQVYQGKLPIFRYGWIADVPEPENFLYRLFHSQSPNNLTHYQNRQVDQLLDRARAEQDYFKRVEVYRKVERLIMEDSPVVPLNYYNYERLFQPYVQRIEVSALGDPYIPMRKIWLSK